MAQRQAVELRLDAGRSWTEHPRLMDLRRRSRFVDLIVESLAGFQRHRSGRNAALISHYGFLSVFPLMLVLTTILGFVLQNRTDLQTDILDSALLNLPIVGAQIADDPASLRGNAIVLTVALLAALWAGMKAFVAVQAAFDDIHEIGLADRCSFLRTRFRALGGIVVIGGAQVVTAFITTLVAVGNFGIAGELALVLAAIAVNTAVLGASYRWMSSITDPWRAVLPGAIGGGVLFAALQLLGTNIVGRAIANASPVYGTFALTIGLLTWLTFHAMIAVVGAEVNWVLAVRRSELQLNPE